MAEMPIVLTCGDYARVMPLATGEVKPEGIALTMGPPSASVLAPSWATVTTL